MFDGCTSLVGGQGTTYSSSNPTDKTYAHIDGGPSNPGYFTEFKEAYACYTSSNKTLTFYFDSQRSSRTGTSYSLNTADNYPGWYTDGNNASVTKVVFNSSFANARPTTTYCWFLNMQNLQSITGMSYLNTSEVTNMYGMFGYCTSLTSVDLSHFNTSKVTNMSCMFAFCGSLTSLDLSHFNTSNVTEMAIMFALCESLTSLDLSHFNTSNVTNMVNMFQGDSNLRTVYVGNGWSTAAVTASDYMFYNCTSLVGGQGTTWNSSNPTDKTYAHIDGGPSNPGYFTANSAGLRGDADGDGEVSISDVSKLTDYLLTGNASGVNLAGADADQDGEVAIADVSAIIDYLLSGNW
jgi:surface protein